MAVTHKVSQPFFDGSFLGENMWIISVDTNYIFWAADSYSFEKQTKQLDNISGQSFFYWLGKSKGGYISSVIYLVFYIHEHTQAPHNTKLFLFLLCLYRLPIDGVAQIKCVSSCLKIWIKSLCISGSKYRSFCVLSFCFKTWITSVPSNSRLHHSRYNQVESQDQPLQHPLVFERAWLVWWFPW